MADNEQRACGLEVPLTADSVDSPIVQYGGNLTAIHFTTNDGRWGRVTFERLDSIRVSRGEYDPYPAARGEEWHWVTTVSHSRWLRERYEYEKKYYATAYNFGGDVNEMVTEFSHYVFHFHDEFVEALAAGIWFESGDDVLGNEVLPDHPLKGLRHVKPSEEFEAHGITCQVRRSPLAPKDLEARARLCSQTVLEVGAKLDGRVGTNWSLTRRVRNGVGNTYLRDYFGNVVATYDEIPALEELRPRIDQWLSEVKARRHEMGKD